MRELVAAAKLFAQDFHNLFGVVVVFGKDQGLGQLLPLGEHVRLPAVAQGAHHGADLVGRLHGAVQLFGLVFKVVVQLPGGLAAGGFVLRFQPKAFVYLGAAFAHFGFDAVHVVVDVHAIGHGLGVAVFHDQVLVEEAKGLLGGRGGQANQIGVKVLQHLAPQVVDAAVGLVGDHNVKALDGDGWVVANGLGVFEQGLNLLCGFFVRLLGQLAPFEHAEHALDGADDHAGGCVELVALQVLDDVFLAKLVVVVGAGVGVELFFGLAGQVAPIHQEEHAARSAKLDEAVDEADAGKGLAAAGGHLDEGLGFVGSQGFFQIGDGADLGGPQSVVRAAAAPFGDQRWHGAHAGQEGAGGFADTVAIAGWWKQGQPLHQQLGAEEGEHAAGARFGIQPVGEVGFYARAFPHKGKWAAPGGQGGGQAFGVAAALQFDAGERGALLLGFDDAAGFAVDVEHVVGKPKAVVQRKFANCHAHCRMDIGLGHIANVPARRYQQCIYRYPGFGLWCHACSLCGRF